MLTAIFCVMAAVEIDYGASEIYSRADMDAAIEIIRAEFDDWQGCELHNIRYAGDAANNAENLRWMNDLAPAHGYAPKFVQCIEFISDFYVSAAAGRDTAFSLDREYKNWQWWLARTNGGDWKLLTWGY